MHIKLYKVQWVRYFCFFLLFCLLYWYFRAYFFLLGILFLLLLPCLSAVSLYHSAKHLSFRFLGSSSGRYGAATEISFFCKNSGILPLPDCQVDILQKNTFVEECSEQKETFSLLPFEEEKRLLPLPSDNLGQITTSISQVSFSDFFGLFQCFISPSEKHSLTILPENKKSGRNTAAGADANDLTASILSSMDSGTDLKELRDYRAGDSLSHIHWKLSGKYETLMVRVLEELQGEKIFLAIDLYDKKEEATHPINSFLEEVFDSLLFLTGAGYEITAGYLCVSANHFAASTLKSQADVLPFFQTMLRETTYETKRLVEKYLPAEESYFTLAMPERKEDTHENTAAL